MDRIFLEDLQVQASVGLLGWEKETRQALSIDCSCYVASCAEAASTGDVSRSIDYASMREQILSLIDASHYDLLETLAELIAQTMLDQFDLAQRVTVSLRKTTIFPDTEAAGVAIDRPRVEAE